MTQQGIRKIFAIFCCAVSAAVFLLPIVNSDIFWHLSAAREMIVSGVVPRADWLSFTMQSRAWVDFEWLCQLLWHGTLQIGGWWGLVTLKAALFMLTAACLWKMLELYSLSLEAKALAIFAWSLVSLTANDLRPENFSMAFFALELWMLESRRLNHKPPLPIWALPPIYALWANLHAGFVYGWILLAVYAAVEFGRKRRKELAAWALAALAATLVNPYGWDLHQMLLEHARDMSQMQTYIGEWQAPDLRNPWALPFWVALFAAFAVVLRRYWKDRKVPYEHLLALGFFSLSASSHKRLALYFSIVAIGLVACHLSSMKWPRDFRWRGGALGAAALALFVFFWVNLASAFAIRQAFIPRYVPNHLIHFLDGERATLKGHRMMHPWHWGGYLGYYLYPDLRVFFDGRYIFHPLLKPAQDSTQSPKTYQAFLESHQIDLVLAPHSPQLLPVELDLPGGKRAKPARPYYVAFLPEQTWALVYWDDQGMIFAKRSAFEKAWIDHNEYRAFRPFDQEATDILIRAKVIPAKRFSQEIERYIRWSPDIPEKEDLRKLAKAKH